MCQENNSLFKTIAVSLIFPWNFSHASFPLLHLWLLCFFLLVSQYSSKLFSASKFSEDLNAFLFCFAINYWNNFFPFFFHHNHGSRNSLKPDIHIACVCHLNLKKIIIIIKKQNKKVRTKLSTRTLYTHILNARLAQTDWFFNTRTIFCTPP